MLVLLVLGACDGTVEDKPVDDTAVRDTDGESDADTDVDGDTDTDTAADTDTGRDTGPIERSLDDADMMFIGQEGDNASQATVADFDGDGTPDIAISASTSSVGAGYQDGLVYVVTQPVAGTTYLRTVEDRIYGSGGGNGLAMTTALDADGDGVTDAVVLDGGPWDEGYATLLLGPVLGARSFDEGVLNVNGGYEYHLVPYPDVADLDGDGGPEILINGGYDAADGSQGGAVVAFPASWRGAYAPEDAPTWLAWEDDDDDIIGPAEIGDVDGDGVDDIVVGLPRHDRETGAVYIFLSPIAGVVSPESRDKAFVGSSSSTSIGSDVALCDFDGDGRLDLVVGASGDDTRADAAGAVRIIADPLDPAMELEDPWATILGAAEAAIVGAVVAAGDLDGDGLCDIATHGLTATGAAVYVHSQLSPGARSVNASAVTIASSTGDIVGLREMRQVLGSPLADLVLGGSALDAGRTGRLAVFGEGGL